MSLPSHSPQQISRGILLMVAAVTTFALLDTTAKYLSRTYPVPEIAWARYAFQMLLVLAVLGPRERLDLLRTRRPLVQLVRGALLAMSTLLFFTALTMMPIAEASAIGFTSPLIVALLSVPLLRERIDGRTWVAVLCGFAGVLVIIRPGAGVFSWSAILPIGMAMCFAFFQILTRKLAGIDRTAPTHFYPALIGTLMLSAVLPFYWIPPQNWGHATLFVLMGLLGGLGHFMLIRAFDHAPAPVLAPFVYTQMVAVLVLGYAVFGDLPDRWSALGMAVVAASGAVIATRQRGVARS